MHDQLKAIARRLGFDTLDTRNSDRLDFRKVAVGLIRDALEAAYKAGRAAGPERAAASHAPRPARR